MHFYVRKYQGAWRVYRLRKGERPTEDSQPCAGCFTLSVALRYCRNMNRPQHGSYDLTEAERAYRAKPKHEKPWHEVPHHG